MNYKGDVNDKGLGCDVHYGACDSPAPQLVLSALTTYTSTYTNNYLPCH